MRVLDTNILIHYLQGEEVVVRAINGWIDAREPFAISTVTLVELLSLARLSEEEIEHIERFVRALALVPLDAEVARLAATFRRQHRVKLADAVIAATAFLRDAPVVTRNVRDFQRVSVLEVERV